MGGVRELNIDDGPALAQLHLEVFGRGGATEDQVRQAYSPPLLSMILDHQYADHAAPSMVFEDQGDVVGFVLNICRPVMLDGERIWVATTSHLAVRDGSRSSLAGIHLLRAITDGPQDATYIDRSNSSGRKAAEAAGFVPFPAYSLRWTRRMQPAAELSKRLARKAGAPSLRRIEPLVDTVMPALVRNRLSPELPERPAGLTSRELTIENVVEVGSSLLWSADLHPVFDDGVHLKHEWDLLERTYPNCDLLRRGLFSKRGDLVAWYIVLLRTDDRAEVVQFVANKAVQRMAFIHLLHDIADTEHISAAGRLPPNLFYDVEGLGCVVTTNSATVAVHAKNPRVLETFRQGRSWLTSMEGETLINPVWAVPK